MPTVKLPITGNPYKNLDPMEVSSLGVTLIDGYSNEAEDVVKDMGLLEWATLGTATKIDGMFWWEEADCLLAVSGGHIFKITNKGVVTNMGGATVGIGNRPAFQTCTAANVEYCFIANDSRVAYLTSTATEAVQLSTPGVPGRVTHLAFLDSYILANSAGMNTFAWSDVLTPLTWAASNLATVEGSSDKLVALLVQNRDILLLGTRSAEIWYDDGTSPFSRYQGAFIDRGCIAPYSAVNCNNTWYWLDHTRRLVRLDGRSPVVISTPFDKELQAFTTVEDCVVDVIEAEGKSFLFLNFPTEDRTLVYDFRLDRWREKGYWNQAAAKHERWLGNCYSYAKGWNLHLVGSRRDGKIYRMSSDYYDDDGNVIRMVLRTGHNDCGSLKRKVARELRLKIKRGFEFNNGTTPYVMVRWRDDGKNVWSNEHQVSLQKIGSTDFIARMFRLGMFRTRQWEFSMTDSVPLILCANPELDVEYV